MPLKVGSPTVLFQIRESFRHACQDALSCWEKEGADGKVKKVDILTEDWEDWKANDDIRALPFETVMKKACSAADDLKSFAKKINDWDTEISVAGKKKRFTIMLTHWPELVKRPTNVKRRWIQLTLRAKVSPKKPRGRSETTETKFVHSSLGKTRSHALHGH